jgi:RimJ/RimL family protein N-acetyltransferase
LSEPAHLRTARLSLRRPEPADVDVIYRIHHDPLACAHNPGDLMADRSEAEDRYQRWDEHWRVNGFGYWVVERDGEAIGFCGLKVMRLHGREILNLLYRLDPSAWGGGVATEAATAVVAWAGANESVRPVVARVRPANFASQRVAERVGLRRAAELDTDGEDGLDWIYVTRW